MKEAKPIFVIGLPGELTEEMAAGIMDRFNRDMSDYHVILVSAPSDVPTFQAFYEKDFNEVKYEELKQIVKDAMSNLNKK